MPFTRFDTAQLDGSGTLTVSGPINFAADEQLTTEVTSLSFVLVQGNVFVHGVGSVDGKGSWAGEAKVADKLAAGQPAQGFGVAMLVKRAEEATHAAPARPPVVQTLNWSEAIKITT